MCYESPRAPDGGEEDSRCHNEENHVFTLTYPSGHIWKFHDFDQYDYPEGALKEFSSPGGQTVTATYDGNDRLTRLQRTNGTTVESFQDAVTVARFPNMLSDEPEVLRATGTMDVSPIATNEGAQHKVQQLGRERVPVDATVCDNATMQEGKGSFRNNRHVANLGEQVRPNTKARPAGLEPATCGLEVRCSIH